MEGTERVGRMEYETVYSRQKEEDAESIKSFGPGSPTIGSRISAFSYYLSASQTHLEFGNCENM